MTLLERRAARAGSSSSRPKAIAGRQTRRGARARSSPRSSKRCSTAASTSRSTARRTFRPSEDPRLRIAAYLPRADPRDALVVRTDAAERRLDDLPAGSRVGTDSPRRTGFLLARRPDLEVHPLHGNVDTRLRRLDAGETDALVLACAGLDRLGLGDRIAERLEPEIVPPAPGQGAIAIQIRHDDARMLALPAAIDDRPTRLAVEAERAFLSASGGGCRAPIGALASDRGRGARPPRRLRQPGRLDTVVARRRGPVATGPQLGRELAAELDPGGRSAALPDRRSGGRAVGRRRVLVTRAAEQAGRARVGPARRGARAGRGSDDRDRARTTAWGPR